MATLLIDDQRNLPADRVARTYQESINALSEQDPEVLYKQLGKRHESSPSLSASVSVRIMVTMIIHQLTCWWTISG